MNNYKNEVSERFGDTNAYKEFIQKTAGYTETDFAYSGEGLSRISRKFAECKAKGNSPESEEAKALVKELKEFISENFYTCTDEILKGLGVMYTADERFKVNIDSHSEGTANFIAKAIECCCK